MDIDGMISGDLIEKNFSNFDENGLNPEVDFICMEEKDSPYPVTISLKLHLIIFLNRY